MKLIVAGILSVVLLCGQTLAQPSPSPSPIPSGASKEDLKKSVDKFSQELKETKKEAATALENSKKPKPKPKPSPSPSVARRKKSKPSKKPSLTVVGTTPKPIETDGNTPAGDITTKPIVPLNKVEEKPDKKPKVLGVKKKKTFWQKLWHILPFRFFGEH